MISRGRTIAAGIAFAVVVCLLGYAAGRRADLSGRPHAERWVLQDFRDAVYYPVVALLDGRNPYDQEAQATRYPVGQAFPLYLPSTLVVHVPFGVLPPAAAGWLYFGLTIVLTGVVATLAIGGAGMPVTASTVLALLAVLLLSRPGEMNLLLGQVTAQVTVGAYVALRWARERPLLAGAGLALATIKPTYGVPLAMLMLLGRGDVAAVVVAGALSVAVCVAAVVPLVAAAGGTAPFVASLWSSATAFSTEGTSNAWSSFARIDGVALLARALGRVPGSWSGLGWGVVVMGAAIAGLRRLGADRSAPSAQLGVGLICLTVLVATYHQTYDALLLAQPAVALGGARWGRGAVASPALRWTVLALIAVPFVNYLASQTVTSRLAVGTPAWLAITTVNPLALLGAWVMHLGLACRTTRG